MAKNEQQDVQQALDLVFRAVADGATASSMPLRRMQPGAPCGPKQFSDPEVEEVVDPPVSNVAAAPPAWTTYG